MRVAGVNAHRVEVLDRADDDDVVGLVAHHLQLELLPADDRFLDQHLADRARVEPAGDEVDELLAVVGDAAAGAAQREARPQHARQADLLDASRASASDAGDDRLRHRDADLDHRLLELLAVLGLVDDVGPRADHLDLVLFQHAVLRYRSIAVLRPVWPPSVGSSASGRSFSMIFSTTSQVIGSM